MSKRFADDGEKSTERPKKRRSRWQDGEEEKTLLSGLPTTIPFGLTKEQEEQYLLQLQIEETTRRLRSGELGIPVNAEERSPSPEPIYDSSGKRLNTREFRVRKKLEEERHKLVQEVLKSNPNYKPPFDYRPLNIKVSDKVMIPQEEYPLINFVGLLIGPRGNTLKGLEKETGACIIIRGKGSVKEGKLGIKNGLPLPGQDEPLHAYVTAPNPENVKMAVDKIKQIIREGIAIPDSENDLRKQQLRELALLNGTLREGDPLTKLRQLQQAQTIITNTILCTVCGGAGHIGQDCKQKRPSESLKAMLNQEFAPEADRNKMDSEYMSLMAELGEAVPAAPTTKPVATPVVKPLPAPWCVGSSAATSSSPSSPSTPSSSSSYSSSLSSSTSISALSVPPKMMRMPAPPSSLSWQQYSGPYPGRHLTHHPSLPWQQGDCWGSNVPWQPTNPLPAPWHAESMVGAGGYCNPLPPPPPPPSD